MARALADPADRWGDLRLRVASATVLAPVVLGCLWLGGWPFSLLILAAAIGLAIEWRGLCRGSRARTGALLAGIPYLVPGLVALPWLRADDVAGRGNVLFVLMLVWASDIGAYAAGRLIGGPKLAPAISPGKTWSGALGGLVAATSVAWFFSGIPSLPPGRGLLIAACLGIASQAGDLLESAIKRHFGVKDSGRLIPGHGGLLDRIDGLLAAAPAAALVAAYFGRGVVLWR